MTKEFTLTGEWFLPGNKEQRVHGTLSFHPQNDSDLELYGSWTDDVFFSESSDQSIILGLTGDSKKVTLYNCYMTEFGTATLISGEESGKPSITY